MATYKIIHPATSKVVNLYSTTTTGPVKNGDPLLLYNWENNNDQKWELESIGDYALLRIARDRSKVMNRHSVNNNAHVWYYDGSQATQYDSVINTETINGNMRIKLVYRNLYLTKNSGDNYLSWAAKIESSRQYFKLKEVSGGGTTSQLSLPVERYDYIYRGFSSGHLGIDYTVGNGTAIRAASDGIVIFKRTYNLHNEASTGWDTMGNCVFIQHPDFGMTLYMHMNAPCALAVGSSVSRGQTIGYVGMTGNATGNHLHFGLKTGSNFTYNSVNAYNDGIWADPAPYIS